METQTQIESPIPKYDPKDCKGIHVRISTKQKTEQSMQKQDEPVAEVKGKKLRKKGRSKHILNYPNGSKTGKLMS